MGTNDHHEHGATTHDPRGAQHDHGALEREPDDGQLPSDADVQAERQAEGERGEVEAARRDAGDDV